MVLLLYTHICLLSNTYVAILPVFWFTSVPLGGFGFSPQMISLFMALGGIGQTIWVIVAFASLQRRFGTGSVTRGCSYAWPLFFALWPLCNVFRRMGWEVAFWILAAGNDLIGVGVSMAFSKSSLTCLRHKRNIYAKARLTYHKVCCQLMINDISPSSSSLAMLNAIALTLITALRAVAPGAIASIYAIGVEKQIMWGYLDWFVNILFAISMAVWLRWLPPKAE